MDPNYTEHCADKGEPLAESHKYILDEYEKLVKKHHPTMLRTWPVVSGYNLTAGSAGDCWVHIFNHTGTTAMTTTNGIGEIDPAVLGFEKITDDNIEAVRANLERHFRVKPEDGVVFLKAMPEADGSYAVAFPADELQKLLLRHEHCMGLAPMKIFLSHKTEDKGMLRDFAKTLTALGFIPWLDEDAMSAGDNLERSVRKGFSESCAVVFFITDNFVDERYLASEVDYAIQEKRSRNDKFAIITLCFNGATKNVPELLKTYVFKQPQTQLEAIREILRALPVRVGDVRWRT